MTTSRTVVPGEWYAVLGDDVVVLLPPAAKDRVAATWERVDEGAGFDEVLDALISRGLRDLPAFVLVSRDEAGVKVVVRGAGRAELTTDAGPVTVAGSADTTWVERTLTGVTGLRVRVADGDGTPYVVGPGLVRVAEVREPAAVDRPAGNPPPENSSVQDSPAETGPLGAVASMPRAVARLVLSSGPVVEVDRVVIVGRAPHGRRRGDDQARLVTVPSPHQEISSTHVEFRPGTGPDQGSAVVTDLGSTNGTVIVQPGLRPEDLRPGIPVQLNPGAVVDLGEGITIEVE